MEPASFLTTLERLWNKSELLLWALATACLVAFLALVIAARFDAQTFGPAAQSSNHWLLPIGLALLVLAGFKTYHEKTHPPVRLVPREQQCFFGVTTQKDGRMTVQISGHFQIYNLSDQPLVLTEVRAIRPRITGQFIDRSVMVRGRDRDTYSGRHAIAPREAGDGSFHLFAFQDFSAAPREVKVAVKISDQFGRWHKLAIRRVRRVP